MIDTLQSYPSLISEILKCEYRLDETLEQFKAVALLNDGTRLHINEVWIDNVLEKYAYYWLDPDGQIIQGWDNAPHHTDIDTYPHHTHIDDQVEASNLRSLTDILEELEKRFTKNFVDEPETTQPMEAQD